MKIAVVQHRLRETAEDDARALPAAAMHAVDLGAEFILLPEVLSLHDPEGPARDLFKELLADVPAFCLMPHVGPESAGAAFVADLPPASGVPRELGSAALLVGDACMDAAELARVLAEHPAFTALSPRAENDLQAEAVLELALGLSYALSGLVLIAECAGAEPGEPGHGGSAIVLLGELLAEASSDDDILLADVTLPIQQPEPREPLPEVPTILLQRLAHHHGGKLAQPYPADLS